MMKFKTHHYRHCLCFSRVLQKMKNAKQIIIYKKTNQRYRKTDILQLLQLNRGAQIDDNFFVQLASIMRVKYKSNPK
ncbi:MAG: hypothetical protein ACJAZP_000030 [Psychromonas sp.]|jgi:hypothetical protein